MIRTLFSAAFALLALFALRPAVAADLLSPVEAERLGMSERWHRQIGAIGGAKAIVDARLWVQQGQQSEYVEVFVPATDQRGEEVVQRFLLSQADLAGEVIGMTEAARQAKLLTLRLERRGITAETRNTSVHQVRLYTLTNDGGLTARDAETGDTLWTIRLGDPRFGYARLGINDRFVSVLNGTSLYQVATVPQEVSTATQEKLNVSPGWVSKPIRMAGLPQFGLVNSQDYVFTLTTQSAMESFLLGQPTVQPGFEKFHGKPSSLGEIYPRGSVMMWSTEKQFIYAAQAVGNPHATFRLRIDGRIEGGLAAASGSRFFGASTAGRIYGIDARGSGTVLWNDSLGEPFYGRPFVSQERVYVASGYGNLFAIEATSGRKVWPQPTSGVQTVFSQLGDQLVGRNRNGQLLLISTESGEITQRAADVFIEKIIVNEETDRFYLVGRGGMVQCLSPIEGDMPTFLRDSGASGEPAEEAPAAAESATPTTTPPAASGDPFGTTPADGSDPFGTPPADGDDPFGSDPFAADPFG